MDKHTAPPQMLKDWLQDQGRKKGWLARQLTVDGSTLTRWLTGAMIPNEASRVNLARVTGLAIADRDVWESKEDAMK